MKIVVVSPFWNAEKFVAQSIESLKNQYYTNFVAYYIDDMSTDNSYEVAKKAIGNDERFVLIKNTEKKYKTKNFIDVIHKNNNIEWDDVIIELDGDDCLIDNFVLGLINKIYSDENVWVCGSKWQDKKGNGMKYGRANADKPRSTSWNFSHMRTFRSFLFRSINEDDLKYNGEYFKAACDLGHGMPILEMAGNEHYYFLDKVTYLYNWHDHQSYSNNNSFGDKNLQGKIAKHIYSSKRYEKIKLIGSLSDDNKVNDTIKLKGIELPKPENKIIEQTVKPKEIEKEIITEKRKEDINRRQLFVKKTQKF